MGFLYSFVMTIKAQPIAGGETGSRLTDIAELTLGPSGLRIVIQIIAKGYEDEEYLEVLFSQMRGFRFLDEGDLIPYWKSGEVSWRENIVYEIESGGWMMQELQTDGMLMVTNSFGGCSEWFIATSNGCVNVISRNAPLLRKV
jgi:hypothetical protein